MQKRGAKKLGRLGLRFRCAGSVSRLQQCRRRPRPRQHPWARFLIEKEMGEGPRGVVTAPLVEAAVTRVQRRGTKQPADAWFNMRLLMSVLGKKKDDRLFGAHQSTTDPSPAMISAARRRSLAAMSAITAAAVSATTRAVAVSAVTGANEGPGSGGDGIVEHLRSELQGWRLADGTTREERV